MDERQIKEIYIFDFDGTLVNSPIPETGKAEYKAATGQDWPFKGWWGRPETLDMSVFKIEPISSVVAEYEKIKDRPDVLRVMLTGRIKSLSKYVEVILDKNGLKFDLYFYNQGATTLDFKLGVLNGLISEYTNATSIFLFDDRDEHIGPFRVWGQSVNPIDVKVIHVK
jgi:HAD domain family 1 in Swiss Army Knife RNA repair proteins